MKLLLLLVSMTFCCENLRAEVDYPITPVSIQQQIDQRSVATVHDELFSHPYAVNMLLLAIDSAQPDWLYLANLFLQQQDAVSGPRIIMAVGEGLQWRPANVLQQNFPLQKVCSLDGVYEWRRFSRFLVETAIQRRITALEKLLQTDKNTQKCLQILIKTKNNIPATLSNMLPQHSH